MKAEAEFVNSLSDEVCKNIQSAISRRIEMRNVNNHPKMVAKQALVAAEMCVEANFISAIAPSRMYTMYDVMNEKNIPTQSKTEVKEEKMGTDIETARRHMDTRLYGIKSVKREALKTQFGLTDDARPASFTELAARLKAGLFTLPTDDGEFDRYDLLDSLRWRDPAKKEDRPGFDAAEKLLQAAATKVKDAIWVKTNPEDALAALEAFESSTVN